MLENYALDLKTMTCEQVFTFKRKKEKLQKLYTKCTVKKHCLSILERCSELRQDFQDPNQGTYFLASSMVQIDIESSDQTNNRQAYQQVNPIPPP